MAYNILKLKIKDKKLNYQKLAKELRISESGLNKKINGKNYFTECNKDKEKQAVLGKGYRSSHRETKIAWNVCDKDRGTGNIK